MEGARGVRGATDPTLGTAGGAGAGENRVQVQVLERTLQVQVQAPFS